MSSLSVRSQRSARLARLRRRIERIERGPIGGRRPADAARAAIDAPHADQRAGDPANLDPLLASGGRAKPALHELVADGYGSQPAVRDFSLTLVASLLHRRAEGQGPTINQGMVLWCQRQRDALEFGHPYGPGLRSLGLPPDRLLMVIGKRDVDCLWAMEQGLASRSLLAVVGVVGRVGLIASRRLSLAARAHDTWCLLLPLQHGREPSAARTRWRIKAAPSFPDVLDPRGLGLPSWQLDLERSENGSTGHWIVEWDHAAHHFHLAPPPAHQPMAKRHGPNKKGAGVIAFERAG